MKAVFRMTFIFFIFFLLSCAGTKEEPPPPIVKQHPQTLEHQLDELSQQIVLSLTQTKKSKIAVIQFSDLNGNISEFGRFLAEELITRLYRTGQFEVIERQLLIKVLEEHSLSLSGIIDASSARELGRILGVDAIASGTITDLVDNVKVNARLISTETGKVFSVASTIIAKNHVVKKLMGEGIQRISQSRPARGASSQTPRENTVTTHGFCIELKKCEMSNRTLLCQLAVTNNKNDDQKFSVRYGKPDTKIFDNLGNEFRISRVEISNSSYEFDGRSYLHRLTKTLLPDVPVDVRLYFDKVSADVTEIKKLQINCHEFDIEFRDIPISRI